MVTGQDDCKPLLKWAGGKTSELVEIMPRIPTHQRYFEPFFGGGSVYFNKVNCKSYVNDKHSDLMMFYSLVKDKDNTFFSLLSEFVDKWESDISNRKNLYLEARDRYNNTENATVQKTIDFFILREYAYGGMFRFNSSGGFNVPFGHTYINKDIRKKVEYLQSPNIVRKLENLELFNYDFEEFLELFQFTLNDFMFVDPPYNCSFTKYGENDFLDKDQIRLRDILLNFKGNFMLVVQLTPLIKELYSSNKLFTHTYSKKYKFNIKGRFNRSVKHVLITNYDPNI